MPIDYSKYPPNWLTEIRPRILERAKNCCEQCFVKNYEIVLRGTWNGKKAFQTENGKIFDAENGEQIGEDYFGEVNKNPKQRLTKIILTIAHLDHDKDNFEVKDERLKALCQRCHLSLDKEFHAEKRRKTLNNKKGLKDIFD